MKKLLLLFFLLPQFTFAQSTVVKETIKKIDIQDDPIQSIFSWITDNIRYDVAKRDQISSGNATSKRKSFKSPEAYQEYLLETLLKRKKGVCEDYSLLFHSMMQELGYESYMVGGYVKRKGRVATKLSHRWNAVKVDGAWKLFDPTWAAGYVKDGKKFVKKYFPQWYNTAPEEMIKTHMPFDPIWQLSDHPISYKTFESNNSSTKSSTTFDYKALIDAHLKKGEKERMQDELDRSIALGDGIRLISKWRKHRTNNLGNYDLNSQPELLNNLNQKNKAAVGLFNEYIAAKNKRFKSKKWTIPYAKKSMETVKQQLNEVIEGYESFDVNTKKGTNFIKKVVGSSKELLKRVDVELEFLDGLK